MCYLAVWHKSIIRSAVDTERCFLARAGRQLLELVHLAARGGRGAKDKMHKMQKTKSQVDLKSTNKQISKAISGRMVDETGFYNKVCQSSQSILRC